MYFDPNIYPEKNSQEFEKILEIIASGTIEWRRGGDLVLQDLQEGIVAIPLFGTRDDSVCIRGQFYRNQETTSEKRFRVEDPELLREIGEKLSERLASDNTIATSIITTAKQRAERLKRSGQINYQTTEDAADHENDD